MDVMNEINLDFIDRLEKILEWKPRSIGKLEHDFDTTSLYTTLFNTMDSDTREIPSTSVFNIFILLGIKPKRDAEYLRTKFKFEDGSIYDGFKRIDDIEQFLDQVLAHMIEFINISSYIYNRLGYEGKIKQQKDMLKFLIVTASSIYDELYSSRGKIEFAYYFKKILQNSSDITVEITRYNKETWRKEFSQFTRDTKVSIDEMLADSHDMKQIDIANIALIFSKMTDVDLLPLEERFSIQAGTVDYEIKEYNPIFITNFL